MFKRKKERNPGITGSSMADIAFLLLIFFFVSTTINADKGLLNKLPPWCPDCDVPTPPANDKNVLIVLVNNDDKLFVDGEISPVSQLKELAKEFIDNNGKKEHLSVSPTKAIISLQNDRRTSYDMYIQVQNEVKAAYRELRDNYSLNSFGKSYSELNKIEAETVRKKYPMRLSEAEPKDTEI